MYTGFFVICWYLSAVVGALIGATKGRPTGGAFWGLFLGPLGWLMIFSAPDSRPTCPECLGVTIEGAKKCLHCGSNLISPTAAPPTSLPQSSHAQNPYVPPGAKEEELAEAALVQAQDYITSGQPQLAQDILRDLVRRFPKTQAALTARRRPEYQT